MLCSSYLNRGLKYIASHPSHFTCYFGFGAALSISALYLRNTQYEYIRMGFAGSFAQIATEFFFHPIDVINTRTKSELKGKVDSFKMTRRIYSKEGLFGFTHGLSATYYGALIGGLIYFSTYKFFKKLLKQESNDENKNVNFFAYLVSASIGELFFMIIYYPFDLIRTRMQTQIKHLSYKDLNDGFKQIVGPKMRLGRLRKLYVGATPSFILNISNQCLMFSITESLRDYNMLRKKVFHVSQLNFYEYHMCSATAGAIAGAITNVLEVVTINKQIQGKHFNLRNFIKEHGFYSFRAGILARMLINSLHAVTLFTVVDEISKFFGVEL
jgi:hypothetical protein